MIFFKIIPLLLYILLTYLIVFFVQGDQATAILAGNFISLELFSGALFNLSWNGLLLVLSVIFLFFEIIKSTRTSNVSIIDHTLSALVFIGFLVVFIVKPQAASESFFIIMLISLIDVIAGFTITIASARRDLGMNNQL